MSKKLNTDAITNELAGSSVFFQRSEQPHKSIMAPDNAHHNEQTVAQQSIDPTPQSIPTPSEETQKEQPVIKQSSSKPVHHDVTTSILRDVNKKRWRDIIEETETHNSSIRMSLAEREQVEDMLRDLKRKYKIKTSMNELARLGLLVLLHDFKKNGKQSIITDVKTS